MSVDSLKGKYQGYSRMYVLSTLTYHVPVPRYWLFSLVYSRDTALFSAGGACCPPVETTNVIGFSDQEMDERSLMHGRMLSQILRS